MPRTVKVDLSGRKNLRCWKAVSLTGFIAVNAVLPIGGLYFLDWNLYEMAVLYWTENLIIGVFMILQLLNADVGSLDDDKKLLGAIPSLLIYFPLCLGQAILIQYLFQKTRTDIPFAGWPVGWYAIGDLLHTAFIGMFLPALAIAVNYSLLYARDYIGAGECFYATVGRLSFVPVVRLILMQGLIMAGLSVKKTGGSLLPLFAAMIILKILLEWLFDIYKRRESALN